MVGSADNQELAARCLQGDSNAWAELFRANFRHAEMVALAPPFRFHSHEAEDIAQETMIELARKLADIENIPAFVGTVAHNKCVDRVRKMKPVLETDLRREDGDGPVLDQAADPALIPLGTGERRIARHPARRPRRARRPLQGDAPSPLL